MNWIKEKNKFSTRREENAFMTVSLSSSIEKKSELREIRNKVIKTITGSCQSKTFDKEETENQKLKS